MYLKQIRYILPALLFVTAVDFAKVAQAEDLEHSQQLITTGECPECDLSRSSMVYMDLSMAKLKKANLSYANLSRANLTNADLQGADLSGAVLFNANLAGADLTGANLTGADLRQAYLVGANLDGAILNNAQLNGSVGMPEAITSAQVLFDMGLEEAARGNFDAAYDHYTRVLELEPNTPEVYLARSLVRYQVADVVGAIDDANTAESLFREADNVEGEIMATSLSERIIQQQEVIAEGPSAGKPNFLNLLESAVPFLFQFAF
ncbi:MAG: pentapeptide repeat-containing protein [Cyanobacteria bacterium P01_F01_bin.150]